MSGIAVAEPIEVDLETRPGVRGGSCSRPRGRSTGRRSASASRSSSSGSPSSGRSSRRTRRPGRRGPVPVRSAVERHVVRHRRPRPRRAQPLPLGRRLRARPRRPLDRHRHRARGRGRPVRGLLAGQARRRAHARAWTSCSRSRRSSSRWCSRRPSAPSCGCSCSRSGSRRCRAPPVSRAAPRVEVVEKDFVRAAEAIGLPRRRILMGEVLPEHREPAASWRRPCA